MNRQGNERQVLVRMCGIALVAALIGCASSGPVVNVKHHTQGPLPGVEDEVVVSTSELHRFDDQPELLEAEPVIPDLPPPALRPDGAYRIGPGDILLFRSFDDITLDTEVQVRYDGQISLPLIPDLKVADLTRDHAIDLISEAYGDVFQDPTISLTVRSVGSKDYFVMGSVNRPAQYPYVKPITILDAINIAGGKRVSTRGGDSFVGGQGQLVQAMIIRNTEEGRMVGEFDLKDLDKSGPHVSQTLVYPGDIVYVPEGVNLVYVMGELGRPGVFELTNNMTLMQLIAGAGGFIEQTARMRQVVLMREIDEDETKVMIVNLRNMLKTGADIPLEAGDVVYIPQKRLVRAQNFVQQFTGTISPMLSLYRQALGAYYEDDRLEILYGDDDVFRGTGDIVALQGVLQDVTSFISPIPFVP